MLCENCYENQANIHITKIVNGKKVEKNLCYRCSKNSAGKEERVIKHFDAFQFSEQTSKILSYLGVNNYSYVKDNNLARCDGCGTSFIEFKESGLLGCGECYEIFYKDIKSVFKKLNRSNEYNGKIPKDICNELRIKGELKRLKEELYNAINNEKYEEAANLRDEIKKFEFKIGEEK